jgi:hypothetical protein
MGTMNNANLRKTLEDDTSAFLRSRNPDASPSTTTGTTRGFRLPILLRELVIKPVPTDDNGTLLPYVVLLDRRRAVDVATWTDVRTNNRQVFPETEVSPCMLIATRNKAEWEAVRPSILDGGGNGEPGSATDGTGSPPP